MKKNFFLFALIPTMIVAIIFVSCRKGEKGEAGPAGASSSTPAYTNGSITGLLEGTTFTTDSAFALNLNYQYYKGPSDNFVNLVNDNGNEFYEYSITRYDETGNSYIKFDFTLEYEDPTIPLRTTSLIPEIDNTRITIVSHKPLSNNRMFYFATTTEYGDPFDVSDVDLNNYLSEGYSGIEYENITVDPTTGALSFDYYLEVDQDKNSTGSEATMAGTVNLTPYNVVYRIGASE